MTLTRHGNQLQRNMLHETSTNDTNFSNQFNETRLY